MKRRIALLTITILAVVTMGIVLSGCGSDDKSKATTKSVANVPTDKVSHDGNGVNYVEDDFATISHQEKTTDKNGNNIVKYTNTEGNFVTRTEKKNGTVIVVVKDKNGKVIKKNTIKLPKEKATKKSKKKETKKGSQKSDDGWSDFY